MNPFVQSWRRRLLAQADELVRRGEHRQAARLHRELCEGLEQHLGEVHPQVIEHLRHQAACHRRAADLPAAEAVHRRLLRLLERRHGTDHPKVAQHLNSMGVLACEMGRHRHAADLYQRALASIRRLLGDEDPRLAALHHNLGTAYHCLAQPQAAEHHYREALRRLAVHRPSAEHADCLRDLAELTDSRRPEGAQRKMEQCLAELRQVHRESSPELAQALIRVAGSFFRMQQVAAAHDLLCEASDLLEALGPDAQDELAACRTLIAQCAELL